MCLFKELSIKKFIVKLVFVVIITTFTFAFAGTHASLDVPQKGTGIWVNSIGSFGQLKGTNISVYLVDEKDFKLYQKTKQLNFKPKGVPPLYFDDIDPGHYYIGFEIIIDKNVIKPESYQVTSPFPTQGVRLVPEKYFANDVPIQSEYGLKVVVASGKPSAEWYITKWYSVNVKEERIYPIVSLFFNKESTISDLAKLYPQTDQFKMNSTKTELEIFWNGLEEFGTMIATNQRKQIIGLLKRGGVVCLPPDSSFKAIFVNSKGKIIAKKPLENSNETEILEPIVSKKQSSQKASETVGISVEQKTKGLLPLFNLPLIGNNEVRIKNPNDYIVYAGVRSGDLGKDFQIAANNTASIFVPNGHYQIYFVYSNKPNDLYQGENFTLNDNGIEIQIVKVVGGNYGIRRVK